MNGKDVRDYLPYENLITDLSQPFGITETTGSYDVLVNVNGGGFSGQAGATRHGIARALLTVDPDFRGPLKKAGMLTRCLLYTSDPADALLCVHLGCRRNRKKQKKY